jgi:putative restriction endonuclease
LDILTKYLHAFEKLHIDRAHGNAPHKPILLLSVLQSFQNNQISDQRIYLTPELVGFFKTNWSLLVTTKHDCRISYPFYYLKSDKFWQLVPKSGFENINQMGSIMKSFSTLNVAVDFALISDDLYLLMKDERNNRILQHFLLDEYFPDTKSNFINSEAGQYNLFNLLEEKILHEDAAEYKTEIQKLLQQNDEEEIFIRGSIFKREIPRIYNYTCCISGMKISATSFVSMVDACHIIPFSHSFDDTITNGIALCPNLHRAFDRGLIAIDSDYRVKVSGIFNEERSIYSIKAFEGQRVLLPAEKKFFPLKENLEWHRINKFEKVLSNIN